MILTFADHFLSYFFSLTAIPFWLVVFIFFLPFLIFQFVRQKAQRFSKKARLISQKYHIIVDPLFLPQIERLLPKAIGRGRDLYNSLEDNIYKRTCWFMRKELSSYVHKGESLLDVGSGRGYLDLLIKKKLGAIVTCVDVFNYSSVDLPVVLFNGVSLPFADKTFDVVLLSYVLHHSGKRQIDLLKEAKRVCRERIIIYEDEAVGGIGQLFRSFHGPVFNFIVGIKNGTECIFHSSEKWKAIFTKLGLTVQVCQTSWNLGAIVLPVKRAFFVLTV